MEKIEIQNRIKAVKSVKDLARLLCDIKKDEFHTDAHPITEKQLKHFCNPKIATKRYKTFLIPKKRGGTREISSPTYQLGCILYVLNILLKSVYFPRQSTMGFVEGRSVALNAAMHKGHHYVLNIDLSNFFPSIRQARVWKCLQLPPYNFPEKVASVIAGVCCNLNADGTDSVLPQGAATSPLLSNIVCQKLDKRLEGVARRFGLHYSRYADDMTFSSMHNVYQENGEFISELRRIVKDQGFSINESKTRLLKNRERQEVTGLVVNEKVNVNKKYIRQLRFLLFKWQTEGYATAYALFYRLYKREKGYIKKGEPMMENVIGGKLNYLKMVRGTTNTTYQKLAARYASLQELMFVSNEADKGKSYVYVQPYTLKDFEELFHTSISLQISRDKKVVGKCIIEGSDKVLAISKSTQKVLCPNLEEKSAGDVIQSEYLEKCFVTLCRNQGENFWLITKFEPKRSLHLSIQDLKINADELLSLWETEGFDSASLEFAFFVQYGRAGESILNWNPLKKTPGTTEIDRGFVEENEECLLNYFLTNRHLTNSQKNRFLKLLSSLKSNESSKIKKVDNQLTVSHSPQMMIKFLSLFSRDDLFKWYTHKWDDSDAFKLEKLKRQQDEAKKILAEMVYPKTTGDAVNEKTYNQVWNFINFKPKSDYPWKNNKLQDVKIGWHSVDSSCEDNIEVSLEKIVLEDGYHFIDYIRMFKAVIEFRTDLEYEDRFSELIYDYITTRLPKDFDIAFSERFDRIGYELNVYCDVVGLLSGLGVICNWIIGHKSISSKVRIDLIQEKDYYILDIAHCDSYFNNIEKLREPSGDFDKLRKRLFSVCDFTIEGDYYEGEKKCGSLQVPALDANTKMIREKQDTKTIETLTPCYVVENSNSIGGVKYLLKIYRHK